MDTYSAVTEKYRAYSAVTEKHRDLIQRFYDREEHKLQRQEKHEQYRQTLQPRDDWQPLCVCKKQNCRKKCRQMNHKHRIVEDF